MAADGSGNVVVTGQSAGTGSGSDYATIAYSSTGVPLWTNRYNGPANTNDSGRAVVIDGNGNVYVTGSSTPSRDNPFTFDYRTVAYSSTGSQLWTNPYADFGDAEAFALAVDREGNVIVTGQSWGEGTAMDFATVSYSSAGVPIWTNRFDGEAHGWDVAQAIAVDSSGAAFVTGQSWNGTNYDYVTIKYAVAPVRTSLQVSRIGGAVLLSWTNGAFGLQSAPTSTGSFTNIPGATSPWTNPVAGPQQYFRLISN